MEAEGMSQLFCSPVNAALLNGLDRVQEELDELLEEIHKELKKRHPSLSLRVTA